MGWEYVVVTDGCLGVAVDGVSLDYPLTDDRTGEPAPETLNYRGDAWREGDYVGWGEGAAVRGYRIAAQPTERSRQYLAGRQLALRQIAKGRRRQPTGAQVDGPEATGQYWYGWYATWEAHKKGQL